MGVFCWTLSRNMPLLIIFLSLVPGIFLQTTDSGCNCVSCKTISSGDYNGTYSLNEDADKQALCASGCFYTNNDDGTELCLCDPGDVEYTLADTCSGTQFDSLTSTQVTRIKNKIKNVVNPAQSNLATALRLSFHDCVGGCDGCININNEDNAGLADTIAALDTVYTDNGYDSVLSRADFWAIAGIYAVDKTIALNDADCEEDDCQVPDSGIVFQWGRVDCDTAPYTDVDVGLPSALLAHTDVMSFFATEFGFDANETVALMGAHTLGGADPANSGFTGIWITDEALFFNNEYYKKLIDTDFQQRDSTRDEDTSHWQWNAFGDAFMLNVDVSLYKEIVVNEFGESSCDFDTCAAAPTATAVEAFAASNEVWITAFTSVFTKMLAHGSTGLADLS